METAPGASVSAVGTIASGPKKNKQSTTYARTHTHTHTHTHTLRAQNKYIQPHAHRHRQQTHGNQAAAPNKLPTVGFYMKAV